ncbi:MAG: HAMP domain-containing histidine kinase [Rhodospirillaceae bacterium]|nr:HAMP domain-containing histidine kinase [Rhodospirillaceae bacterium]
MADDRAALPPFITSLSARLLILTVLFVMLAEFLIWTPSISRFRKSYLEEHVLRAHLATLALEAMPDKAPDSQLEEVLLEQTEAYGIVLKGPERRTLMLANDMPPNVDVVVDLRRGGFVGWISDAFSTLSQDENRVLRIIGMSPKRADVTVEVLMDETPMREAMYAFSARILQLSIVISLFTAGLVYLSLRWLMVRPIQRITSSITAFRRAPQDATRELRASNRSDEIGMTERELAKMQGELRQALGQKERLATLGAAVAKINHDLRNSLATAVLAFDRLATIDDPEVKSVLPRLYNAVDRAVQLCSQTLDYAGDAAPTLKPSPFHLQELVSEAAAAYREPDESGNAIIVKNGIDFSVDLEADRAQLYRVFSNLISNAREAGATVLDVVASKNAGELIIDLTDNGPGFSEKARTKLFEPFAGSAREGGTGLGLVIVRDVLRAHGGDVELVDTGAGGSHFRISLPDRSG